MKINFVGILGGILLLSSVALPWWSMAMSIETLGINTGVSVYLYQVEVSGIGAQIIDSELLSGWTILALVVISGVVGLVGCVMVGRIGKGLLSVSGLIAILILLIFAVNLQNELSNAPLLYGISMSLFSRGSTDIMGITVDYSSYLSFGFWLTLIAAIITLISLRKHPTK